MALRAKLLLTLTMLPIFLAPQAVGANDFSLRTSTPVSSEGYLSLNWESTTITSDANGKLRLQVANNKEFSNIFASYELIDQTQVSISGLPDGQYFARLISTQLAPVSDVASFRVEHRDLHNAWLLFSLGALLFVLLIATIFLLSRTRAR